MRQVVLSYRGHKFRFPIGAMNEQEAIAELQSQLTWSERFLIYCCYVNCEIASRTITECMEIFFKRKDIYRHKVKKQAKEARKSLNDTIEKILLLGDKEFLDNYSANFCIDIWDDIDRFRDCLLGELVAIGMKEAELYAYVNTAFVMLEYCMKSYDKLMDVLREKFHRDFSELYTEFCPTAAYKKWDIMFDELFKKDKEDYDIDLSENRRCKEAIKTIDDKLLDYNRIREHIIKAYEELPDEKKTDKLNKTIGFYDATEQAE